MSNVTTTPNDLIAGLSKPTIPIAPFGALYRETTTSLANKIVDLLSNNFGIIETDHVFMYPVTDKNNRIVDFDMYIYFNTRNSAKTGRPAGITRITNNKATRGNDGRVDLSGLVGGNFGNGGFRMEDNFKKVIGSLAVLNNDGNIVVQADREHNFIAVIRCDFFKAIGLCLGITSDDNYDFSVIDCQAFRNNAENLDYTIVFTKEISMNNRRRGKDGINYEYADRRNMKSRRG